MRDLRLDNTANRRDVNRNSLRFNRSLGREWRLLSHESREPKLRANENLGLKEGLKEGKVNIEGNTSVLAIPKGRVRNGPAFFLYTSVRNP